MERGVYPRMEEQRGNWCYVGTTPLWRWGFWEPLRPLPLLLCAACTQQEGQRLPSRWRRETHIAVLPPKPEPVHTVLPKSTAWAGTREPKFACLLLLLSRRAATNRKKWLLPPSTLRLISHPVPPVGHGQDFSISSQARESGKYRLPPCNPVRFKGDRNGAESQQPHNQNRPYDYSLFFI